jgi:hypothetical protein
MSEINDLNIKSQKSEIFERKKLRPWDDPVNFIPSRIFEKTNNNEKNLYNESAIGEPIGKQLVNPLVNNNVPIGKQLVNPLVNNLLPIGKQEDNIDNPLVNNKITIGKPIGKQKSNGLSVKVDNLELDYKCGFNVIKQLGGLQKKALFYIVDDCKTEGKLHT